MQDQIVQIRRLCEELLNKNVDVIKRSNMSKLGSTCISLDGVDGRTRTGAVQSRYAAVLARKGYLLIINIEVKAQITDMQFDSTSLVQISKITA